MRHLDWMSYYYYGQVLKFYTRGVEKMRVISGTLKRKPIVGDHIDGTRPTMDRVKESLFAMIQMEVKNSICLDLFAGSGSLGIEALSNGASFCYFVEHGQAAGKAIQQNLKNLNLEAKSEFLAMDYKKALKKLHGKKFDLIFLDPPYQAGLMTQAMEQIATLDLLTEEGLLLCEYSEIDLENIANFVLLRQKKYGNTKINVYKKKNGKY